jgi:hypothetical protein
MWPLGWYPGAQHPGSRWRKWGEGLLTKEAAIATVIEWMADEHAKAISKGPAIINEDMFDSVMAGLSLPASLAPGDGHTAKQSGHKAKGHRGGRAGGKGRGKSHRPDVLQAQDAPRTTRPKRAPRGTKRHRPALSPFMSSSGEDSDTSTVPVATQAHVQASSSRSPPRATASNAIPATAAPAKAIPTKVMPAKTISAKAKAKPTPVPGSTEDMVRQARAELRKPKRSQ